MNTPISQLIRTNCTVIEARADIQNIRFIFDHFPNHFLPVVNGLRFIGIILRDEFYRNYIPGTEGKLKAADLISKEMVILSPENNLGDAKEIFESKIYDIIPVTDEDGDLMGIILREDVEIQLSGTSIFSNPILSNTRAFA